MLITQFNKLIRSRILWGSIAVVIAFAFVGSSVMSRSGCDDAPRQRSDEGVLFGETIRTAEFLEARYFETGLRQPEDTSAEAMNQLRYRTWARLASIKFAEGMGITAGSDEIRDTITKDPTFQANGTFDPARYQAFLQRTLRMDAPTFERYIGQEVILSKLRSMLQASVWTSPYELEPRLERMTDLVNVSYTTIARDGHTNAVTTTEAQAREYFDAHRQAFAIPERISVRYVAFPVIGFETNMVVSDAQIAEYYDSYAHRYTTTDTNGVEQVTPLDEVRAEIEASVRKREAGFRARDAATDFSMALSRDRFGKASTFEEAAAARKLEIQVTPLFSFNETPAGLDAGADFTRAAFELVASDPDHYFSDAIMGVSNAYVIAFQSREDARDATFEEVREEAMAAAREQARRDAFKEYVARARATLDDALSSTNTTFTAAAETLGLSVSTTGVFAVFEGLPEGSPYGNIMLPAILETDAGELAETVPTPDGVLVAAVTERRNNEAGAREMLRPQLLRTMDQLQLGAMVEGWADYVLAQAEFEDYRLLPPETAP